MLDNLQAGTQYGDWKGSVAADEFGADDSFDKLFEAIGEVDPDKEIMIGFNFYWIEGSVYVSGYFHDLPDENGAGWYPTLNQKFQADPDETINVKKVDVQITLEEFFKRFKRFNAVFVNRALDIIGREIHVPE